MRYINGSKELRFAASPGSACLAPHSISGILVKSMVADSSPSFSHPCFVEKNEKTLSNSFHLLTIGKLTCFYRSRLPAGIFLSQFFFPAWSWGCAPRRRPRRRSRSYGRPCGVEVGVVEAGPAAWGSAMTAASRSRRWSGCWAAARCWRSPWSGASRCQSARRWRGAR